MSVTTKQVIKNRIAELKEENENDVLNFGLELNGIKNNNEIEILERIIKPIIAIP